jgi:HD superfamily phosphohydrolase
MTFDLNSSKPYEFRCPIHGFIVLNDWERAIISEPAFQRLRRIRQLAWTDQVYPSAMHTRFEHSLGVMHTATLMYDTIRERSREILESEFMYNSAGLDRDRQLVRLAALLHDVGHGPFSHASEDLLPLSEVAEVRYTHEQYSAAIVRLQLRDVIDNHPHNNANYGFKADDVASLLEGSSKARQALFWRDLIDGQLDADRMDYLLRDSYHVGVQYGQFDLNRLIQTIEAISGDEGGSPRIGISEGGFHAAEALVLARYFMFTQVYFHKTRVAYDIHSRRTLKNLLSNGVFPKPTENELSEYLKWDDWRVLGLLAEGKGGEDGQRLATRKHFRCAYHTPEVSTLADMECLNHVKGELKKWVEAEESASKSWYKTGTPDIRVRRDDTGEYAPLSSFSSVLSNLKANNQVLLYVRPENAAKAKKLAAEVRKKISEVSKK